MYAGVDHTKAKIKKTPNTYNSVLRKQKFINGVEMPNSEQEHRGLYGDRSLISESANAITDSHGNAQSINNDVVQNAACIV